MLQRLEKNGAKDFVSFYSSLCALQSSYPVACVSACAREGVLNCHLHTIERLDLHPILSALRVNTVLHTVVFYNKWQEKAIPSLQRFWLHHDQGNIMHMVY